MADMHDDVAANLSSLVVCCPRTARRCRRKAYPASDPSAGAGLRGAPPTETGPKGLDNRDVFLRDAGRARAFGRGIEEVVSGVIAFCRESTRAISEEN